MIERQLYQDLLNWKNDKQHKPLLVRGARQVGKTSLIEKFGNEQFAQLLTINFELEPDYKQCFATLDPHDIINAIQILKGQNIVAGETLLFFDEIQDCPAAIQALRYFKENMPELHVIGAGSLLELVLNNADFRMPVGRISSLYLHPISFKEYLNALNPDAAQSIAAASLENPVAPAVHTYLTKQVKHYFLLGGMPEVIAHFLNEQNTAAIPSLQADILATYENDFGHYAKRINVQSLQYCYRRVPLLLGQQIKYSKLDQNTRSRDLKISLQQLTQANLIKPVYACSGAGIPLAATMNEKKFKLNFVDLGLASKACGLDSEVMFAEDVALINRGALAEQFVGQELLAYSAAYENKPQYFWARDGRSNAKVDYLHTHQNYVLPIEVKAGSQGRLRSLQLFMQQYQSKLGLHLAQHELSYDKNILAIPFYMLSELERLIDSVL